MCKTITIISFQKFLTIPNRNYNSLFLISPLPSAPGNFFSTFCLYEFAYSVYLI